MSRSWSSLNPPKPEAEDVVPVKDLIGTGVAIDEPFAVESTPEAIRASLEALRLESISESWNNRQWLKAESYLKYHLSEINTLPSDASARRVRHLLGVCASYKGHWHRAILWFISVIRTPVDDLQHLDRGDRAALYWLGDVYSLLNRKEEALLAYCLAGACDQLANISMSSDPHRCLSAEQEQLRQTVSKETFRTIWADESFRSGRAAEHSILHSSIVTQAVAQARLQSFGLKAGPCRLHSVEPCSSAPEWEFDCISDCVLISPAHFESRSPWPMPLDPMFNMTNVAQGRLCTQESNFLELVEQGPERLQVRKRFASGVSGAFVYEDLPKIIVAFRQTLVTLAMGWSELIDSTGAFFSVRYNAIQDNIVTVNYFRVEIIRMSL